jgi:UDP-N-acetylmuramoyl-L-alanyl-D-glutamate--2,6-diaminopimelate ligase
MQHNDERASLERLARAAGDLVVELPTAAKSVTGLAYDAGTVRPGDLFFCIVGLRADGHEFAEQALSAGAVALCVERSLGLDVPEIVVTDTRRALARLAAEFYGHPGDDLVLLGVTGTNGKTTTAYLLESILGVAGYATGLIGTIETRVAGESRPGVRTTPESLDLQRLLAAMRERDVGAVAMEVTSHALALHRVETLRFACAGFTNMSQDHLDFHADMEDYFAAKRSLFVPERAEAGAVNVDDPYGRRLRNATGVATVGFGLADDADVRAQRVTTSSSGSEFVVSSPVGELKIATTLVGGFNVSNCLAACACALQAGIEPNAIEDGIARLHAVPGRFEAVDRGQPFTVVVDYAHTPDSLDNVLREARRMARLQHGRVLCLFGCGGDRDRAKRPLMGAVAARLADVVVVTSDNPRSEDPEAIIGAILEGVLAERPQGPDATLVDRREAIGRLLVGAWPGDVAVIAGKGHEAGQQIAGATVPFDDRVVATEVLASLGWSAGR